MSFFDLSVPESPALTALKSLNANQLTPLAELKEMAES